MSNTSSRVINISDFGKDWFYDRAREMGEPHQLHRKLWEFCAIAQVFAESRVMPGQRALGFGVGREPLASWLAAHGAFVTATDRPDTTAAWSDTGQHATSLADLWKPQILSRDAFERRVIFQPVDMNAIPTTLQKGGFDYTWSAGSFEHIGSFDASIRFFCEQMKCLRPGGVAAHTTEYNPNLLKPTLESRDLVLFRQYEIDRLEDALREQGDELLRVNYQRDYHEAVGSTGMPHINLAIGGYVTTSILLVAIRGVQR